MSSSTVEMNFYSRSKLSMTVFGSYLIIVGGIGFGLFPHLTSSLVGLETSDNTYIRLFGLLAGILGINYLVMVQQTAIIFFKLSIAMRYSAALFMLYLVTSGLSHHNLLLFALGDTLAATWTLVALRYDSCSDGNKCK